jgi:hypothetical protein
MQGKLRKANASLRFASCVSGCYYGACVDCGIDAVAAPVYVHEEPAPSPDTIGSAAPRGRGGYARLHEAMHGLDDPQRSSISIEPPAGEGTPRLSIRHALALQLMATATRPRLSFCASGKPA